jgi:hypothetical protein
MKNRKMQFLLAVRILAPNDKFILNLAGRVREGALPPFPGGAALEFVAALCRLREASREPGSCRRTGPFTPKPARPAPRGACCASLALPDESRCALN